MKLTFEQRRWIIHLRDNRAATPSFLQLVYHYRFEFLAMLLLLAPSIMLCEPASTSWGMMIGGMMIGMFIMTFSASVGILWGRVRGWPLLTHIIDWKRVDEILENNEYSANQQSSSAILTDDKTVDEIPQ